MHISSKYINTGNATQIVSTIIIFAFISIIVVMMEYRTLIDLNTCKKKNRTREELQLTHIQS